MAIRLPITFVIYPSDKPTHIAHFQQIRVNINARIDSSSLLQCSGQNVTNRDFRMTKKNLLSLSLFDKQDKNKKKKLFVRQSLQ
jgi:hypothetical protein